MILLPWNDKELRNVMKRVKYSIGEIEPYDRILPQDWEILLASLFKREIDLNRLKNRILEDMVCMYSFFELFNLVDIPNQGFLDHLSLKNFLLWNEHFATKEELIAIIRRIDTNGDSKIDYQDFLNFITIDEIVNEKSRKDYLNYEIGEKPYYSEKPRVT